MNLDDELRSLFADKGALDLPVADDAQRTVLAGARRLRKRRRVLAGTAGALGVAALVTAGVVVTGVGGPASMPPADPTLSIINTTTPLASTSAAVPRGGGRSVASGSMAPTRRPVTHPNKPDPTTAPLPPEPAPPENPMAFGPDGFDGLTLGMTGEQAEASGVVMPNAAPVLDSGCKGYDFTGFPRPAYEYSVVVSDELGIVRIASLTNAVTPEGVYRGVTETKLRATYPDATGTPGTEWDVPVPGNPQARYEFLLDGGRVYQMRVALTGQDCVP